MVDQALKLIEYHCNKVFIVSKFMNHKWYKIIEISNLRGHSWVLQLFVVVLLPSHATPLYCASVSMDRNLAIVPPPQNLSHEFHCPHSPHTQSTKDVEERNVLSNYIWLDFQFLTSRLWNKIFFFQSYLDNSHRRCKPGICYCSFDCLHRQLYKPQMCSSLHHAEQEFQLLWF